MSFADWSNKQEEEKKKKKKKEEQSFADWSDEHHPVEEEDIAPVRPDANVATPFGAGSALHKKFDTSASAEYYASQRKTEDKDDSLLDLFDKGAFADGFDWSDIPKVILGTAGDAAVGAAKGFAGFAEGFADLAGRGVYKVRRMLGETEADLADYKKAIDENTVGNLFSGADEYLDQYSVLGRTANAATEGLGQYAAMWGTGGFLGNALGLGAKGAQVAMDTTLGLSSLGSGISEAYLGGATDEEALKYGASSAALEVGFEKFFGGMGKGINMVGFNKGVLPFDDMAAKAVSKFFKGQTGKNIVEGLVKGGFEGFEELGTGFGQALAKKATYMSERELSDILEDENLFEQFFVGMLVADIAQGSSVNVANKTGRDYVTGNTRNEQSVIDKELEKRIAEAEKNGKKLSGREKNKILDAVTSDMERGYIDTDTIEEVLGGDSYKSYKDTIDKEEAIKKEFEELKGKQNATLEEQARFREVRREYYRLQSENGKSRLTDQKNKLSQDVFNRVKGDRLAESYNEKARVYEDFKADFDKYKGTKHEDAAKKTIENAIKAGANNTNRVHDLVDMAADLSSETGYVYDFKDGEQIKNDFIERKTKEIAKLEAIENRTDAQNEKLASLKELVAKVQSNEVTVNGNVDSNGIVLNLDSAKPLNRIVGHEITHTVEKAKNYDKLRDHLFAYAKSKGVDIDAELAMKALEYEGVEGTTAEAELVADLVGDYLFTDSDFVKSLSTENRSLAQRIYDEIKYFITKATKGSKEERELLRVKHDFEKAFRASAEKNTANSGENYSIERTKTMSWSEQINGALYDGKNIRRNDTLVVGQPKDTAVAEDIDNKPLAIPQRVLTKASSGKDISHSIKKGKLAKLDEGIKNAPITIFNPDRNAVVYVTNVKQGGLPIVVSFDLNAEFDGDKVHKATSIHLQVDTMSMLESLPKSATVYVQKNELDSVGVTNNLRSLAAKIKFIEGTLSQQEENVNSKFSLSDSNGKTLSNEQAEFFKDSKVRDENGNLKVVYHGTRKADFTVFKRNATYFTDNKEMADSYSPNGDMYEGYVNITKPYEIDAKGEKWSRIPIDDATRKFLQEYGSSVFKEGGKWRTTPADIVAAIEEAIDNGDMDYDGIIIRNIDDTGSYYKGKDSHLATDYIVFNSNQFKNADNKAPTSDPDIRFSLSKAVEETKDLVAVHNLQSSELFKTIELGGLAMPSIAVIKARQGHEQYGDVSLIFPKDTIDPKANRANKVYGGDAWTPTHPRTEYKPSEKVQQKIKDKYYELAEKFGYDDTRHLYRYVSELEGALNGDGGEAGLLDRLYDDDRMMQVYLMDSGKGKVEPVIKETRTEATESAKEMNQWFIDRLGEDVIREFKAPVKGLEAIEHRKAFMAKYGEQAKQAYRDFFAEKFGFDEDDLNGIIEKTQTKDLMSLLRNANVYLTDGGVTIKTETDFEATEKAIREKSADGYKEWIDNLFKGVEEKSGIRNNLDKFTSSGTRRSWDALHWENTLENVVRAMKAQDQTGADAFAPASAMFAVSHKDYGSIAEIKADSERLGKVSEDEYKAMEDEYGDRLAQIANSIKDPNERNRFIATDEAASLIVDAVRSYKSKSAMLNYMQKWNKRVTESTVDDILSLVSDIANMPTGYFEAKPQRAVSLEEVGVFVIPRNADVKLKQELLNRGYNIAEYDPDVEGDRQKVVNQFEEYKFSLSDAGKEFAPIGKNDFFGKDFRKKSADDIAPVAESAIPSGANVMKTPVVEDDIAPIGENVVPSDGTVDNVVDTVDAPVAETVDVDAEMSDTDIIKTVKDKLNAKITNSTEELEQTKLLRDWVGASYAKKIADVQAKYDAKKNKDTKVAVRLKNRIENLKRVSADLDADLAKRISDIEKRISTTQDRMKSPPKKDILEVRYERINKHLEADKVALAEEFEQRKAELQSAVADKDSYISNKANELYWELRNLKKGVRASEQLGYLLDHGFAWGDIKSALVNVKHTPGKTVNVNSAVESVVREALNEDYDNRVYELDDMDSEYQRRVEDLETEAEKERQRVRDDAQKKTRTDIRNQKLAEVETHLNSKGFSLDSMLDHPKRQLSTLETVDTMPQRVMEKTFGYKEGQALADVTVNKVAQDDTKATKWLDSITNRKTGLLAKLSKQYHIKPGSEEIQAVQMYAEGFFVDKNNDLVAYGDAELAQDFPNAETQKNIKALAKDPRIRQFYDDTLNSMNEVLVRNGYPAVPRLDNYYLHFIADEGILSKLGVPFNPNDAKAKDLPTDLAGRTADLKPGRPFFSSGMHREGKRTSFDLFAGMERYANMAKNVIYQTDNIQTLRAIQYHLCERFGQAHGLDNLLSLDPDEMADRIQQVYSGHLSTFASFLNTEANILAGKTSMIDRALSEGVLGRRVLTFLDAANKQIGSAMVGGNVSSANTNWLPAVRELATSNPADSIKAFAQTVSNIFSGGKFDSFREDSSVYVRRQGADRFHRTLWQKMQEPGFALMGMVDSVSTELIARTEYNKAIREGKSAEQAHYESDLKTSRLMADRSLGQMPQMYTSRVMQLVLKFQLEVRNDLDSMFYDTLQEAKVSNEDIENQLARNAKTAGKVALKYATTAVALHLFGTAFESIAGYNPAFDIIEAISKAIGLDDDEEDEDTIGDNLRQGAMSLLEDMPYSSLFLDGGRIPVSSMFPDLKEIVSGEDENGNEVTIGDIALDIAPYLLPTGGSQLKKTLQGLSMFSDEHPVAGSYTDSGNLRFPVEDTFGNRLKAGLFGQYASKNARDYFDNNRSPLKEKQIQEFIDVDIPIRDYWDYREGLSGQKTLEDKFDYIAGLDLPVRKKNILINNIVDREEDVDLEGYEDFSSYDEFDFATKKPGKYAVSQAVGGYESYVSYMDALGDIESDKDENGKSISGSKKEKVINYIESLPIDYGQKIILFKSMYDSKEDRNNYNADIVEYLDSRDDISYEEMVTILTELGMRVEGNNVYWD